MLFLHIGHIPTFKYIGRCGENDRDWPESIMVHLLEMGKELNFPRHVTVDHFDRIRKEKQNGRSHLIGKL